MKKALAMALLALGCAARADICIKNGDTVAFMGDSITAQGNSNPVGYVNLVMKGLELFGVKEAKKLPAGISGHKSTQMRARLENDVLSKKPQWMTFSCGVNDVWHGTRGVPFEKYRELVGEIFNECDKAGVKVIVLTATMIKEDQQNGLNQKLVPYNRWLREEAKRRNYPLADLNADMQQKLACIRKTDKTPGNKLTTDGVHMAFPGNMLMAWGVLRAMGVSAENKAKFEEMCWNMPGSFWTTVGFSENEKKKLEELSKAKGVKLEEYIRSAVLK